MIKRWLRSIWPGLGRDVWLLSIGASIITGAVLGIENLLRVLYVLRLGYGPEFVGILVAIGSLGFSLCSVPGGLLGGRFGPRRMILIGDGIIIFGLALLPLTEVVPESWRSFWPLLAQLISSGGWSWVGVNQPPALMAFTTPQSRRSAFALREALAGLGMFLGALVGGALPALFAALMGTTTAEAAPYRWGLWVSVLVAAAGLVPITLMRPVPGLAASQRTEQRPSRPPWGTLAVLLVCGFFNNGAMSGSRSFTSAYLDVEFGMATAVIGTITSVGMVLGVIAALNSSRLTRRGPAPTMTLAAGAMVVGMVVMASFPYPWAAAVGMIGGYTLSSLFMPSFQMLQMELAGPAWRSLVSGAASMIMSMGFGTISFTGGYIIVAAGYQKLFMVGAGMAAVATCMTLVLRYRLSRLTPPAPEPSPGAAE